MQGGILGVVKEVAQAAMGHVFIHQQVGSEVWTTAQELHYVAVADGPQCVHLQKNLENNLDQSIQ